MSFATTKQKLAFTKKECQDHSKETQLLLQNPIIIEALKDNKNINFDVFKLKKLTDSHELSVLSEYMIET